MPQKKTKMDKKSSTATAKGKKSSMEKKIATGVGMGLAAAAAATGAYLLSGKRGEKSRKAIKSWALKADKEVQRQIKNMKEMNKTAYEAVVDKVAKGYQGLKNVDQNELMAMVKELKGHWTNIQRELASVKTSVVKHKKAVTPKSRKK